MSIGYLLGIDVGTTRTAAAISRAGARPGEIEIVNLGDRSSAVPSVLYVGDDGGLIVGEAAERRALSDPDHVVREFKRRIGDPTPVLVGGRPWAAEELSAQLVQWVVDRVRQSEGGVAARIAVTHPASWGAHKKDLLGAALQRHGLPVTFLAEPQAAALHYAAAERVEPDSTIAVYDFGGGTFDAAVVHKTAHEFELLGRPEGVERLGGIDLDETVFEHVVAGLPEAFEGLDDADPAVLSAIAALRRECREAKEALSADTEVSIPVLTPAGQGSVRLHRSEFEAMIRPAVEETVTALRRALASARLTPQDLTAVLLVGGSSRIPLVAQLVSEQLSRPVAVDADPKNAIAKGAALFLAPALVNASGPNVPSPRGALTGAPLAAPVLTGGYGSVATGYGSEADPTPPTQRLATSGTYRPGPLPPPPPARPSLPAYDEDDYDYAPPPARPARGRPALLVSAGAAVAAAAVIGTVFLWPHNASVSSPLGSLGAPIGVDTNLPPVPTSAPVAVTSDVPTSAGQPPPAVPTRTTKPPQAPPSASKPPAVTTTVAPPPTTKPTVAPTTAPTTPPTTKPTLTPTVAVPPPPDRAPAVSGRPGRAGGGSGFDEFSLCGSATAVHQGTGPGVGSAQPRRRPSSCASHAGTSACRSADRFRRTPRLDSFRREAPRWSRDGGGDRPWGRAEAKSLRDLESGQRAVRVAGVMA